VLHDEVTVAYREATITRARRPRPPNRCCTVSSLVSGAIAGRILVVEPCGCKRRMSAPACDPCYISCAPCQSDYGIRAVLHKMPYRQPRVTAQPNASCRVQTQSCQHGPSIQIRCQHTYPLIDSMAYGQIVTRVTCCAAQLCWPP